jgi:periplasmic nitrate reductase NapD
LAIPASLSAVLFARHVETVALRRQSALYRALAVLPYLRLQLIGAMAAVHASRPARPTQFASCPGRVMSERSISDIHHISSAVVTTFPERCNEVVRRIEALPDTEVHHVQNSKIVIVLEGPNADVIGRRLAAIALMEGVLTANLVFEHVETLNDPGGAS